MTIGHVIEMLASKLTSIVGREVYKQDATPFGAFSWKKLNYCLKRAGWHIRGLERMRCGATGEFLEVCIAVGVISYQCLKHMVADKSEHSSAPLTHG